MDYDLTYPSRTLSGTHPESLLSIYLDALDALYHARDRLIQAEPNARDYASIQSYYGARQEHVRRLEMLETIINELNAIALRISEWT